MQILALAMALGLAAVHLFVGRLAFLDRIPRSGWLSAAGGVAVAYVFLHVLPELAGHRTTFAEALPFDAVTAETLVYLVALLGLSVFYGLERAAKESRGRARAREGEDRVEAGVFWIHIGSFAIYNALIGYLLLHREETGTVPLVFYFVAMALHFTTNDYGLRQDHRERYHGIGRWLLAAAVLAGYGLGLAVDFSEAAVGFLFAFLAGGVVLNVLKEELPEERKSRFWTFLLGGAGYAALLMAAG